MIKYNKFENVIIPKIENVQKIKDIMLNNGAIGALMSGSGPSVYGIFASEAEAKCAMEILRKEKITAYTASSV